LAVTTSCTTQHSTQNIGVSDITPSSSMH
jgi:hypothetical protein